MKFEGGTEKMVEQTRTQQENSNAFYPMTREELRMPKVLLYRVNAACAGNPAAENAEGAGLSADSRESNLVSNRQAPATLPQSTLTDMPEPSVHTSGKRTTSPRSRDRYAGNTPSGQNEITSLTTSVPDMPGTQIESKSQEIGEAAKDLKAEPGFQHHQPPRPKFLQHDVTFLRSNDPQDSKSQVQSPLPATRPDQGLKESSRENRPSSAAQVLQRLDKVPTNSTQHTTPNFASPGSAATKPIPSASFGWLDDEKSLNSAERGKNVVYKTMANVTSGSSVSEPSVNAGTAALTPVANSYPYWLEASVQIIGGTLIVILLMQLNAYMQRHTPILKSSERMNDSPAASQYQVEPAVAFETDHQAVMK